MNDENMEEVRVLEAQIEHLMAEVAALQDQQQDNQKDLTLQLTGQIHNAMWVSPII